MTAPASFLPHCVQCKALAHANGAFAEYERLLLRWIDFMLQSVTKNNVCMCYSYSTDEKESESQAPINISI